jgi:hypothetical protein
VDSNYGAFDESYEIGVPSPCAEIRAEVSNWSAMSIVDCFASLDKTDSRSEREMMGGAGQTAHSCSEVHYEWYISQHEACHSHGFLSITVSPASIHLALSYHSRQNRPLLRITASFLARQDILPQITHSLQPQTSIPSTPLAPTLTTPSHPHIHTHTPSVSSQT